MNKFVLSVITIGVALGLAGGDDDAKKVVETEVVEPKTVETKTIETKIVETETVGREVPMPAGVNALSWYADGIPR